LNQNKPILLTFILFLCLAFNIPLKNISFGQTDTTASTGIEYDPCSIENKTFENGEEMTYKLFYNWNFVWLAAGEVTFKVKDVGDQFYISAIGRTYKSYEWFYKVRDSYESYVDKETLLPNKFVRDVREGKYSFYNNVTFNQNHGVAHSVHGKTKENTKEEDFPIDNCMHDLLSIIYYARNLDFNNLKPEQPLPIKIFLDNDIYPLEVKYKGKEQNKRIKGSGRFNTIKFSPEVVEGNVFKKGDEMMIWISDDENKIPLMIETPISVGSVKVVLKSYKGLKYDLSSKVK